MGALRDGQENAITWHLIQVLEKLEKGSPMSEADIEYRGHFIDVQSYESDGNRWRPKAIVSIYHSGALHQKMVPAPIEVLFDSETEADTYSLAMAKKWIDDNS